MTEHKHTNRLSHEKSPYLLQHAHNPVDWYPWSDEAFKKAKKEDKPIFLSIGYSTCHWCHVFERESFEDEEVADILNKNFISIKVDREERPDIDHIYMTVCQALTGSGGWPLTIFMTPDKKPFYAGTYFPKTDRMGMPGFITLLNNVTEVWKTNKEELIHSGNKIIQALNRANETEDEEIPDDTVERAFSHFKYNFDKEYGGFGRAPKFPTPHNLYFLLRYWYATEEEFALEMVEQTLESMHRGGIYDHIGFGFSRYSTDKKWLVPHFEKMLYDNALLAIAYLETYQAAQKQEYAEVAKQIFTYVLRDMTSPEGGFYSSEDADSEGVEGKFYVWSPDEVKEILGSDSGSKFCKYYDITSKGNFEDYSIPNLIDHDIPDDEQEFIENCRQKLFEYREKRIHPYKDDKILTAWNGLMIAAMAYGGRVLGENRYIKAAENAVEFIFKRLVRKDGRLMARYRDGEAAYPAYVDDYAFLIWGLLELYGAGFKPEYLKKALELNDDLLKLFWDEKNSGMFMYGKDSEQLVTRPKEIYDGAIPSGNSVSAMNLLRLARLSSRGELEEKAHQLFRAFGGEVQRHPAAHTFFLSAFLLAKAPSRELVIVGGDDLHNTDEILETVKSKYSPFTVTMLYSGKHKDLQKVVPLIGSYKAIDGKTTVYVCENFACRAPITDINQLKEMLKNKTPADIKG